MYYIYVLYIYICIIYIYLPLYIINQPCIRDEKFQEISAGNFKQANTVSGYFFFK